MRAPPDPPYMFPLESGMDELAVALSIDPIEPPTFSGVRMSSTRIRGHKIQRYPNHRGQTLKQVLGALCL